MGDRAGQDRGVVTTCGAYSMVTFSRDIFET